jgi:hypothetical protein
VRHVRILVLCLMSVFAVSAIVAGPALAKKAKEHVPGTLEGEWKPYIHCPVNNPEFINPPERPGKELSESPWCFVGKTSGGKEGGSFTVGGVTVPLKKSITLQGAANYYAGEGETPGGHILPAEGAETLEAPELAVPKGIKLLTPAIQAEANWPRRLIESYDYAKAHKETGLFAKIVVAGGNLLYEEEDALNTTNLLFEEGPAFTLPLRVILSGPWLESLGGGQCTIGTEEHPVIQHLTTGLSEAPAPFEANTQVGEAGTLSHNSEFSNLVFTNSKLVDSTWPVEVPAEGCGGEFESYVDDAITNLLNLPAPAGASVTVLKGTLETAYGPTVVDELEKGTE